MTNTDPPPPAEPATTEPATAGADVLRLARLLANLPDRYYRKPTTTDTDTPEGQA